MALKASRDPSARGVETYYLNFATNPEAEAVAARENADRLAFPDIDLFVLGRDRDRGIMLTRHNAAG